MRVGVNYPWFDYGWDFGNGPPSWVGSRTEPGWVAAIDRDLGRFADLGISVVRWFILADGLTYGVGDTAPRFDSSTNSWRFDPPALDASVLQHFDELLARFAAASAGRLRPVQLLPVLLDFKFCEPGWPIAPEGGRAEADHAGWVKQGRAEAIADPDKQLRLLDAILDPLLAVSRAHAAVIFAWEVMNEPEFVTSGWHRSPFFRPLPVSDESMRLFLSRCQERIRDAGFKSTIGFASNRTIAQTDITADVNQFHYYPGGRVRLEHHPFDPEFPGIIGEFSTTATDRWPGLPRDRQGVLHRLRYAAACGYRLAMPWGFRSNDRHTAWTTTVEDDIRTFTDEGTA